MKRENVYSIITVLAFLLGIVFFKDSEKDHVRGLKTEKERVEYIAGLERKKGRERAKKAIKRIERGKGIYRGPSSIDPRGKMVKIAPPKRGENMNTIVCRSLFNIATLIENYFENKDFYNCIKNNKPPLISYFETVNDPIVNDIIDSLGDLEDLEYLKDKTESETIKFRLLSQIQYFLKVRCETMSESNNPFEVCYPFD